MSKRLKCIGFHCFLHKNIKKQLVFNILDVKIKQTQCLLTSSITKPLYCQRFCDPQVEKTYGFCMFFCESIEKQYDLMIFHQKVNESTVFSNQMCSPDGGRGDSLRFFFLFLEHSRAGGGNLDLWPGPPREWEHPGLARVHARSSLPRLVILYTAVSSFYFFEVHRSRPHMRSARVQVKESNQTLPRSIHCVLVLLSFWSETRVE